MYTLQILKFIKLYENEIDARFKQIRMQLA